MKLPRRSFLCLTAGAAALPALSRIVRAQTYPTRPVRIIVGQAAGSGSDTVARLIGQFLSERLSQQFVIEARRGRKHRHRSGRAFTAGRLHASLAQFIEYHQRNAL